MTTVAVAIAVWLAAWWVNARLAARLAADGPLRFVVPAIFGLTIVVVWEVLVRGLDIPMVILPAPTVIAERFAGSLNVLWVDFEQTFLKGALSGYVMGSIAAFAVAVFANRQQPPHP